MSELTLFLIRLAYLAILWIFVLSAISVIRSDMFGARVPEAARAAGTPRARRQKAPRRRGQPSHLIVVEGSNEGARAELVDAPLLIGRGPDAAIRLDDDYVSTRHARIGRSEDTWYVEDLGSTNGTYLNGERLRVARPVVKGDRIQLGKTVLEAQ